MRAPRWTPGPAGSSSLAGHSPDGPNWRSPASRWTYEAQRCPWCSMTSGRDPPAPANPHPWLLRVFVESLLAVPQADRVIFLPPSLLPAQGHMVMPVCPGAHLVLVETHIALLRLEPGFDAPHCPSLLQLPCYPIMLAVVVISGKYARTGTWRPPFARKFSRFSCRRSYTDRLCSLSIRSTSGCTAVMMSSR